MNNKFSHFITPYISKWNEHDKIYHDTYASLDKSAQQLMLVRRQYEQEEEKILKYLAQNSNRFYVDTVTADLIHELVLLLQPFSLKKQLHRISKKLGIQVLQ